MPSIDEFRIIGSSLGASGSTRLPILGRPTDTAGQRLAKIGVIGAGGVASFAHLPAYRAGSIDVGMLYDPDPQGLARARAALPPDAAVEFFTEWNTMLAALARAPVTALDIAVPTPLHFHVISRLFDSLGPDCPPLLVQKPLADTAARALELVERAEALNVALAVNLNARFVPTFAKAHDLLIEGAIGRVHFAAVTNRGLNIKRAGEWRGEALRMAGFEMAVHHLDLLCWMFGQPKWVFAKMINVAGFNIAGDNLAHFTIGFGENVTAVLLEDWTCCEPSATAFHPTGEEVVVSGAAGTMRLTPGTLALTRFDGSAQMFHTDARWFPDAFCGPMVDLLSAVQAGAAPLLDGRSHLAVLRLAEAAYRSSKTNEAVTLEART